MKVILEICAGSLGDAIVAEQQGADRIELNSALPLGGLTPSLGTLELVLDQVAIPVIAMCRPRASGFQYDKHDEAALHRDALLMVERGVAGIAAGFLTAERQVDTEACRRLMDRLDGRPLVFHRAFDLVADPERELEQLIEIGVARLMTSGGRPTAIDGAATIRSLVERAGDQIEIMPAGGVRPENLMRLVKATGVAAVHAGPGMSLVDPSQPETGVRFDAPRADNPALHRVLSGPVTRQLAEQLHQLSLDI